MFFALSKTEIDNSHLLCIALVYYLEKHFWRRKHFCCYNPSGNAMFGTKNSAKISVLGANGKKKFNKFQQNYKFFFCLCLKLSEMPKNDISVLRYSSRLSIDYRPKWYTTMTYRRYIEGIWRSIGRISIFI